MSIAKSASTRQALWDCPLEETTQTRGSNFLGAVLLFRRLKLPKGANLHSLRRTHTSHLLPAAFRSRRCPRDSGTGRFGRPRKFTLI
jgi:hypothetical protein